MESKDRLRWILDLVEDSLDQPELTGDGLAAQAYLSRASISTAWPPRAR